MAVHWSLRLTSQQIIHRVGGYALQLLTNMGVEVGGETDGAVAEDVLD
jgi:hypothetical protein